MERMCSLRGPPSLGQMKADNGDCYVNSGSANTGAGGATLLQATSVMSSIRSRHTLPA